MTINTTDRTAGPFAGNDVSTDFTFNFKIFSAADLVVWRTVGDDAPTVLTIDTDYTVDLSSDQNSNPGGTVTLTSPLATGSTLDLSSSVASLQPTELTNQGGFFPKVIENALDRLTILFQQLGFQSVGSGLYSLRQVLRYQELNGGGALPLLSARKNKLLSFDSDGNPAAVAPTSDSAQGVRIDLADGTSPNGAAMVGYGATSANSVFDSARPLSYYGATHAGLVALLDFAKASGRPIRLDTPVLMTADISVDFAGGMLKFDCAGHAINSDFTLEIKNPARGSEIVSPNPRNSTMPWCITRWDSNGNWITDADTILASLIQTNATGYYQPSSNDGNNPGGIFYRMPQAVKDQNIAAKIRVYAAQNFILRNPRGRHCLYEFAECNGTRVIEPDVESGGKGKYGTILFTNMETTGYGTDNYVIGGSVRYGTFSAITFMRNKLGGVVGDTQILRAGESGIKTYQNNENGRSARCYQMTIIGALAIQTVFDGFDLCSDYGDTAVERIDDYTLSQYGWHHLPTGHATANTKSIGCRQAGLWGDGEQNNYQNHHSEECLVSGIKLISHLSIISRPNVVNCNRSNTVSGEHQIVVTGGDSRIIEPTTYTDSAITNGQALFTGQSTTLTIGGSFLGSRTGGTIYRGDGAFNNINLGTYSATNNEVLINGKPRGPLLTNPVGAVRMHATLTTPGSEAGYTDIRGAYEGALQNGIAAFGDRNGCARIPVASSLTTNLNNNGSLLFYEGSSGELRARHQRNDGTVAIYQFTILS